MRGAKAPRLSLRREPISSWNSAGLVEGAYCSQVEQRQAELLVSK